MQNLVIEKKKREDDHLVPWALGEKNGSLRDVIGVGGVISSGEYFEFPLTLWQWWNTEFLSLTKLTFIEQRVKMKKKNGELSDTDL